MQSTEIIDYYEVLEVSRTATQDTIERMFRYLAQSCHPDVADKSDMGRFSQLVEAYETLKDPESRGSFDVALKNQEKGQSELLDGAEETTNDFHDRHYILSLFYAQRRRDMKSPGLGVATLESIVEQPENILNFHLWYFREKGWIQREESGLLAITAKGVDHLEEREQENARNSGKFIEVHSGSSSGLSKAYASCN